jgi:RNA polymerase sigma-70 factor (ECF subfamily)
MSNIEAAKIMDISVDALESLLARGRRKLKSALIADAGELMSSYDQVGIPQEGLIQ